MPAQNTRLGTLGKATNEKLRGPYTTVNQTPTTKNLFRLIIKFFWFRLNEVRHEPCSSRLRAFKWYTVIASSIE